MFRVVGPNKKVYKVYDVKKPQVTAHMPSEMQDTEQIQFLIYTDRGGWQYVDAQTFKPYEEGDKDV